tara:strand:- start:2543 stop:3820 length:1278 start_codon:yes stop_codon:yes gene_type:complete
MPIARNSVTGFTLIEIAVVLFILSLLLVGGLNIIATQRSNLGFKQTINRMDRLFEAMQLFLVRNDRLPCPAIPTLAKSDAQFGLESIDETPCEADQEIGSTGVYWGTVPYRTLNLAAGEYADGWDNQIFYVVNGGAASDNSLNAGRWDVSNSIQLRDRATAPPTPQVLISNGVFALISAGPNGSGAYSLNGVERPAPIATSLDELDNLDNDVQLVSADYSENERRPFDDIVRVYTEDQILASIIRDGAAKSKRAQTIESMDVIARSIIGFVANDENDPDGPAIYTGGEANSEDPCVFAPAPVPSSTPGYLHYPCNSLTRTAHRRVPRSDTNDDGLGDSNAEGQVPYTDINLSNIDVIDSWGTAIRYDPADQATAEGLWSGSLDSDGFVLTSYGPDGSAGGGDDITTSYSRTRIMGILAASGIKFD